MSTLDEFFPLPHHLLHTPVVSALLIPKPHHWPIRYRRIRCPICSGDEFLVAVQPLETGFDCNDGTDCEGDVNWQLAGD